MITGSVVSVNSNSNINRERNSVMWLFIQPDSGILHIIQNMIFQKISISFKTGQICLVFINKCFSLFFPLVSCASQRSQIWGKSIKHVRIVYGHCTMVKVLYAILRRISISFTQNSSILLVFTNFRHSYHNATPCTIIQIWYFRDSQYLSKIAQID